MSTNLEGIKPCCVSGFIHNGDKKPVGKDVKLGELNAYVTGDESNKAKTILFVTDIFGYELPNARILADEYAKAGFYVVVPDILNGDPIPAEYLKNIVPLPSDPEKTMAESLKDKAVMGTTLMPWIAKHREAVTKPLLLQALTTLRADPAVGKVGAVGFCFGGRYAILLTHKDSVPQVDCAVANHPSMVAVSTDLPPIAKPVLVNIGDKDAMMSMDEVEKTKEAFAKELSGVTTKVQIYPGAAHGFTIRPDLNNDTEKKQQDESCEATIAWFKAHL